MACSSPQKRGPKVGKTKRGKGTKLMVLADGVDTPLGVHVEAASPAEVKLLEAMLDTVRSKGAEARAAERTTRSG